MHNVKSRLTSLVDTTSPRMFPGSMLLCTAGVVAVVYGNMFALWISRHESARDNTAGSLLVAVRDWLNTPLGLSGDFSALGSCLLLVVGGYSITATASRRIIRLLTVLVCVLAMLWCGIALSALLILFGGQPLAAADITSTTAHLTADILLAGGMTGHTLVPLAWPVVVGLLFGGVLLCTSRLLPRAPWLAITIQLGVIIVAVMSSASSVEGWSTDATEVLDKILAFAATPIVGEVVWFNRAGRIPSWAACAYGAAAVALPIVVEAHQPTLSSWWHPVTALFATLLGVLCLRATRTRAYPLPIRWLASRALALLLVSGSLGYATLNAVGTGVWFPVAACIAALVVIVGAELLHRGGVSLYRVITKRLPAECSEGHDTTEPQSPERSGVDSPL